jgi:putative transposase
MARRSVVVRNNDVLGEALKSEKEPEVKRKLSFLSLVEAGMEVEEAIGHFGVCVATGYNWIRHWNSEGVEGLRQKEIPGRPPRLDEEMLRGLKDMLKAKPYWSLKEVMRLIKELFGISYSDEQTRRILVEKLGMNYAKPFVRDYRRPKDAEDILGERVEGAIKNLKDKGYKDEEMVIGFLDEASPQNQANTVRVLSFGKPRIFKKYGQDES